MDNGNELITAHMECNADNQPVNYHQGLTKREHFAAMAMQNILSRYNPYEFGEFDSSEYDDTATHAVHLADALLKALEANDG